MTMQFQAINGIYEANFDSLYQNSTPAIDSNFLWMDTLLDYESRKEAYKSQLQLAVNGESTLKKEGETFFMFKVTIDGIDTMLRAGFIEVGTGIFRNHWFLVGTNSNNSKSWIYTEEYDTKHREFLAQYNVTKHSAPTFIGSPLYVMLKDRSDYAITNGLTATRAWVSGEEITEVSIPNHEDKQFVRLIITV